MKPFFRMKVRRFSLKEKRRQHLTQGKQEIRRQTLPYLPQLTKWKSIFAAQKKVMCKEQHERVKLERVEDTNSSSKKKRPISP